VSLLIYNNKNNIQQQESKNQMLQAQGQQRVDLAKAQGQMQTMMLQEKRTEADLTRLQDQADLLKAQEIYSTQAAMSSLGAAAKTLAGGIVPSKLPEGPVAGIDFSKVTTSGTGGGYIDPAQQSLATSQFGAVNSNRYGLPEGGYDELNIGNSAALLASNEYSAGLSDEADAYYNAYKAWHEETYPGQPVTYASEGQGKIKSFNKALGYNN
jgi:hypothetical protein